mgnify:FL=1
MENDLNLEPSIMRLAVYGLAAVLLSAVALLSTFAFSAFAVARLRAHAFS